MDNKLIETEFENIFSGFHERLYYYVLHIVQDNEVSRDIVSECFGDVWRNRKQVEKTRIPAYLFACARNKSIKYISKSRHCTYIEKCVNRLFVEDGDNKWEERERRYNQVEQIMKTLSPRTQFVLQKCYVEHFTYKEVAQMLGITTSGVKKHIVKGMSILRVKVNMAVSA